MLIILSILVLIFSSCSRDLNYRISKNLMEPSYNEKYREKFGTFQSVLFEDYGMGVSHIISIDNNETLTYVLLSEEVFQCPQIELPQEVNQILMVSNSFEYFLGDDKARSVKSETYYGGWNKSNKEFGFYYTGILKTNSYVKTLHNLFFKVRKNCTETREKFSI